VTPRNGHSIFGKNLAFKSVEIEELTDVYFFRPAGLLVARVGHALGVTPIGLTFIGTIIGVAGGALLYEERLGLWAFGLIILHSIVDSADGQLARLTGRVTELGRVLDGLSGYATHTAIYLAIGFGLVHRGANWPILIWMFVAGMVTAIHAGTYDYHRHVYTAIVAEGRVPEPAPQNMRPPIGALFVFYLTIQRWVVGKHADVEFALAARSVAGRLRDEDRARYRERFYSLVRGWNFLGDNTRFFAIGILVLLHRIDLFFPFVLVVMNVALVVLWLWQGSADRRFLASLASGKLPAE
jgi:CDP-alcohol phosphatidyltransferase-like enzyme